jgi:predicted dehydrogenase
MNPVGRINRRQALAAGATAAAISIVPRPVLGGPGQTPPSERLNIAGVGIGGQGGWDLEQVKDQNIVALADVDWGYAAHTLDKYPRATKYKDFREMLDKEKGIDAVVVGTPDHAHAIVSMAAIKRGKHVYCEKPLTRTVYEARALATAAREHKVTTQMGNQGMAFEGNRLMTEWLEDGAIGPVREAHVWSDRPTHSGKLPLYWAQGIERPKEQPPVPSSLDWDLWLGPAPWRPYHPAYAPFRWRGWWDFGSGGLGDMGIHRHPAGGRQGQDAG